MPRARARGRAEQEVVTLNCGHRLLARQHDLSERADGVDRAEPLGTAAPGTDEWQDLGSPLGAEQLHVRKQSRLEEAVEAFVNLLGDERSNRFDLRAGSLESLGRSLYGGADGRLDLKPPPDVEHQA